MLIELFAVNASTPPSLFLTLSCPGAYWRPRPTGGAPSTEILTARRLILTRFAATAAALIRLNIGLAYRSSQTEELLPKIH